MHFSFCSGETVRDGLRRIGLEQIDALLEDLNAQMGEARIHDARKRCKMLRALLRLARQGIDANARRAASAHWRDLAHALAGPRDAAVRHTTFHRLVSRPDSCRTLARLLDGDRAATRATRLDEALRERLIRRVRTGQRAWDQLAFKHHGWRLIGPGLKRSYAEARHGWHTVRDDPTDEELHAWRKATKTLWYHLRLIAKTHPKKLGRLIERLEKLGEVLGEDHDLATLQAYAREHDPSCLDVLAPLIVHRRRRLIRRACTLAQKCFRSRPNAFTSRLKSWWRLWRK